MGIQDNLRGKEGEVMSADFKRLIYDLQWNFTLIAEYLSNPESTLLNYNLTKREKEALLTRDPDTLAELCGSQQLAAGALSGAHTPSCHGPTGPPF